MTASAATLAAHSRRAALALLGLLALLSIGGILLKAIQERLLFYPEVLDEHFAFDTPSDEVWLDRPDGARLNALRFRAAEPRGTIVYFHANAGSLSSRGEVGAVQRQGTVDVYAMLLVVVLGVAMRGPTAIAQLGQRSR